VLALVDYNAANDFGKVYLQLREKEGRVYADEEVVMLPDIMETHRHSGEWKMRKESCQRLINYLQKKSRPLKILEVGCGNGWLSHQLAEIDKTTVIGADINFSEIQQAAKVFHAKSNLHFIYNDIASGIFEENHFDTIVFAASIQYFSSFTEIIQESLKLLSPFGEIHIIDSHFYRLSELSAAKQRSLLYFEEAGFPQMINWYFHHSHDELEQFNFSILYDPNSIFNKFLRHKNPFPWVCIKR
jgi:ubiquinone/menaquinone biosynthesis C-methylase UbiE